jgi:hypothetical protein|eukprot:COSAG01_NODE_3310_length_6282_cov_2.911693_5_plen_48_part_00
MHAYIFTTYTSVCHVHESTERVVSSDCNYGLTVRAQWCLAQSPRLEA